MMTMPAAVPQMHCCSRRVAPTVSRGTATPTRPHDSGIIHSAKPSDLANSNLSAISFNVEGATAVRHHGPAAIFELSPVVATALPRMVRFNELLIVSRVARAHGPDGRPGRWTMDWSTSAPPSIEDAVRQYAHARLGRPRPHLRGSARRGRSAIVALTQAD